MCTVLFDKMLTLTEGKFKLAHLGTSSVTRIREEELMLLVSMEAPSVHQLAAPLVDAATKESR